MRDRSDPYFCAMFKGFIKHVFFLFFLVFVIPKVVAETNEQYIKVAIRTIGHEFLLNLGDSTSRVLPVEKMDKRYAVGFQYPFSFEPQSLHFAVYKTMAKYGIGGSCIVEVQKCGSNEVFYSYKASLNQRKAMYPCLSRELPEDCYRFYFTPSEYMKSLGQSRLKVHAGSNIVYVLCVLLVVVGIFFYFKRRKKSPKLKTDIINIGQFQFDQKAMTLFLKAQTVELSSKESDLLFLLFSHANETLERAYILKKVWGDEGDYVGRTLDVFISKLRKKLEADPGLKILNIRGIGYRFVIS